MSLFKQHSRFLGLILLSLGLLAVFQVLWLRQVWQEQQDDLRQETDYIFQKTVMTLQDSLVRRHVAKNGVDWDALPHPFQPPGPAILKHRQLRQESPVRFEFKTGDSAIRPRSQDTISQIKVFITTTDSLPIRSGEPGINRVVSRLMVAEDDRGLILKIGRDTLAADSLQLAYARALEEAGLPLAFRLLRSGPMPDPPTDSSPVVRTEPALSGLIKPVFYTAEFPDTTGFLIRRLLPYFLFSLLLFGVTTAAFGLVYKSLRQQQRLAALKNDFIGNITHELKTPITTVGVALEALSDFEVLKKPEQAREYLNISKLELERLTLLVDKVLRLSMFEEKQPRLQMEMLDLAGIVRPVLNAMKLQAENLGADIRFETQEEGPFQVKGDKLHLSSVVFNLVDNALKYRSKAAPEIVLTLENIVENGEKRIALSVRDNGIGIAPEYRSRVFEKFFRIPTGNIHNVKGHGLGLSYVAGVVRQHGGSIRVENAREDAAGGSRFVVELPVS